MKSKLLTQIGVYLSLVVSKVSGSCGGTLSNTNGTIASPNYPMPYSASLDCLWSINATSPSPLRVHLWFMAFKTAGKMPECSSGDYIEILIGCQPRSIGRFCDNSNLPVFYSLDNCITLNFHSDKEKSSAQGFRAYYSTEPVNSAVSNINSGCGMAVFEKLHSGNIFTPMWPKRYPQYVDCLWRVSVRNDLSLKLFFTDFELDNEHCSRSDYLEIKAGQGGYAISTSILKNKNHCTRSLPFELVVASRTFYIKFESNGIERRRGFMAGFVTYSEEENKFDAKVLVMLAIIFGTFILLGLKMYIKTLLKRLKKPQEEKISLIEKSRINVVRMFTTSRSLNEYFAQRRTRNDVNHNDQQMVFANPSQMTQSQSQFQLLQLPQSPTHPELLSFGQNVKDNCPSSRPPSSMSVRQLAWTERIPSPEGLERSSSADESGKI